VGPPVASRILIEYIFYFTSYFFVLKESCGSEAGGPRVVVAARGMPRRGEIRYSRATSARGPQEQYSRGIQYSSQDSLPDSPYSSQSLDSHTSQGQGTVQYTEVRAPRLRH
jgi:hypothetical protein